jgi:hypothetical protein
MKNQSIAVAIVSDLEEGEMKEGEAVRTKKLLVRANG